TCALPISKILAHPLLDAIPIRADRLPVLECGRVERLGKLTAPQSAKPRIVRADHVHDLVADRAMRIVDRLDKLLMRERNNIAVPDEAIECEVIVVEMAEHVGSHVGVGSFSTRRRTLS